MKKKLFSTALVICAIALLAFGATMAFFTDQTAKKENTFTVGNVDIELSEPSWTPQGPHVLVPGKSFEKDPTITVENNSQDCWVFLKLDMNKYVSLLNLMGVDAYMNNVAGLSGAYPGPAAFAPVLMDNAKRIEIVNRWFTGIDHPKWKIMNLDQIQALLDGSATSLPAHMEIILGYQEKALTAGDEVKFMEKFGMPGTVTQSMMNGDDAYMTNGHSASNFNSNDAGFKMTFTAYAIQSEGIEDIDAAYDALFK